MTATKTATRKFVKPDFVNHPLSILYSCRVRLTDDERKQFKDAYNKAQIEGEPVTMPSIGGSGVRTETKFSGNLTLERALGMNRLVVMDLLNSRDSITIPLIVKMQQVLGLTIFTPERLQEAFTNYLDYIFAED